MIRHTHATHPILNGFTNTCALRTVGEGKPETPPSRVTVTRGPSHSVPASWGSALEGQTHTGKTIGTSLTLGPEPLVSRILPVPFQVLPSSTGTLAMRPEQIL